MKKLKQMLTALALVLTVSAIAQVPQKINYQAVARNAAGTVLNNQPVGIRFTIHDVSPTGAVVYQETQSGVTTNQFGLFTVAIGAGVPTSGTFSTISWGSGDKYLQVEVDPAGGSSYSI